MTSSGAPFFCLYHESEFEVDLFRVKSIPLFQIGEYVTSVSLNSLKEKEINNKQLKYRQPRRRYIY
jgi:hypothetical protein